MDLFFSRCGISLIWVVRFRRFRKERCQLACSRSAATVEAQTAGGHTLRDANTTAVERSSRGHDRWSASRGWLKGKGVAQLMGDYSRKSSMQNTDQRETDDFSYRRFTGPQRRDKALRTFSGLLDGILVDRVVTREEIRELSDWITDNRCFAKDLAFGRLLSAAEKAISDKKLDSDEVEDLRWLCASASSESSYFGAVTHEIQLLQGILHGVLADGRLPEVELRRLIDWIEKNRHLRDCYPITEIESVITSVLSDGAISEADEELAKQVFECFCTPSENYAIRRAKQRSHHLSVGGVCAVDPEVVVHGRQFCFTGISPIRPRAQLHEMIRMRGGVPRDTVVADLDYLVVCENVNEAWAFCAYGRKVERAMTMRRSGAKVLVIRERDLLDSFA